MTKGDLPAGWGRSTRDCPSCLRPVLWAMTERGGRIMLDPAVDDQGNQAVRRDGTGTLRARQLSAELPTPEVFERLLMPHVVTCPQAPGRPAPPDDMPSNVVPFDPSRRRTP